MTCAEAREALLEAEPADLRGGTSELARHLAGCPGCSAQARLILADTQALDAALAAVAAAPVRPASRRRSVRRWLPSGLAVAAALTGILLLGRARPVGTVRQHATIELPRGVEVDLAYGPRDAAVFNTADSTITVVWYFQKE